MAQGRQKRKTAPQNEEKRRSKRARPLSPLRAQMLRRRNEIIMLLDFRRANGIPILDRQAVADVFADCLMFTAATGPDFPTMDRVLGRYGIDERTIIRACRRIGDVLDRIGAGRYRPLDGEKAGRLLRLTRAERLAIETVDEETDDDGVVSTVRYPAIRTLYATDEPREERTARVAASKLTRDREYQRRRRAGEGVVQRQVYLSHSISAAKPWESEGISRATWYRRGRQKDETCPSLHTERPYVRRRTCLTDRTEAAFNEIHPRQPEEPQRDVPSDQREDRPQAARSAGADHLDRPAVPVEHSPRMRSGAPPDGDASRPDGLENIASSEPNGISLGRAADAA